MTATDVRLFIEVTTREAEDAFRRQMEESNHRIEAYMASHAQSAASHRQAAVIQPRELWWSKNRRDGADISVHSKKETNL